jgi:four helix bundle protein
MKSFNELIVWQKGIQLVKDVYMITRKLPKEETFGLILQIRRSSISIPSNIAEGYGRQHTSEYIRFLRIARGSLNELITQLIMTRELGYVTDISSELSKCEEVGKMLNSLIISLSTTDKKK